MARECYGVALDASGTIDNGATQRLRARIAQGRITVAIAAAADDHYAGPRRVFASVTISPRALGVVEGALCELANPHGPSLRGWIEVDDEASRGDSLPLGPFGRAILRCSGDDRSCCARCALACNDNRRDAGRALARACRLGNTAMGARPRRALLRGHAGGCVRGRLARCRYGRHARRSAHGDRPRDPLGDGRRVSAGEAAIANGMLATRSISTTSTRRQSCTPARWLCLRRSRLRSAKPSTGPTCSAAAVGYQVAAILGRLAPGPFQEHGFQSTAVLGTLRRDGDRGAAVETRPRRKQ